MSQLFAIENYLACYVICSHDEGNDDKFQQTIFQDRNDFFDNL